MVSNYDREHFESIHDILAKVYRYVVEAQQPLLMGLIDHRLSQLTWLDWLTKEVSGWIDRPEWVKLSQVMLTHPDVPFVFEVAGILERKITNYYEDIPWLEEDFRYYRQYPPIFNTIEILSDYGVQGLY